MQAKLLVHSLVVGELSNTKEQMDETESFFFAITYVENHDVRTGEP